MSEASATAVNEPATSEGLEGFGYRQELRRTLSFFSNFGVAFSYLSPVVGIYSLYVLGLGTGGPAYLWTIPVVVVGQILVSLCFAELASSYPLAGALFQWSKQLLGRGYGWWVGWIYAWALIITVASVDTGVTSYATTLLHNWFGANFNPASPTVILVCTLVLLGLQTVLNVVGVQLTAIVARYGVWVEVLGTFGVAILLGVEGFHHGLSFLTGSSGVTHAASNPLGVNFRGQWFPGAALIAILANVYIFYGFEAAGDVAEEVVQARRRVPRAMVATLVVGGITSLVLVGALTLSIPGHNLSAVTTGGVPFLLSANVHSSALQDIVLLLVVLAFFSCGTSVQAAGARVLFSYSRDNALPASGALRRVSRRLRTPVIALVVAAILPALFALLVRITPSKPVHIGFITYPAKVNALFILVSFATSGIYLSFQMVVLAALIARLRGWRPRGFNLGRWAYPVYVVALIYGVGMLVNIVFPSALGTPRAALFNYGWMTLAVMFVLLLIGAVYFLLARPWRRIPPPIRVGAAPDRPVAGGDGPGSSGAAPATP